MAELAPTPISSSAPRHAQDAKRDVFVHSVSSRRVIVGRAQPRRRIRQDCAEMVPWCRCRCIRHARGLPRVSRRIIARRSQAGQLFGGSSR